MKIIDFPSTPLVDAEWTNVSLDRIIEGAPQSTYKVLYSSKSGELTTGIYECTAGKWNVVYNEDEFCTLIEGRLRMTSEDGEVQEYQAPDSFLIPSGYKGVWEPLTNLRKFFVIYENIT